MDPNIQGSFLFNNSLNQFPSDLKAPVCQYSVPNSFYKLNPGLNSQLPAGTPHGISDILSRSMVGVSSTGTTTLLSGYSTMGGFGPSVTSAGMYYNREYNSSLGGFSKPGAECPMKGRSVSCWAESGYDWRGGRQQCPNSSGPLVEMSGRKKHTRPTFSGHQIFALEKTFEQTKYLAGPERARLAYSLGMTESQVKVWFQNRRTKWRKKSASEPSSTQASHVGQAGEASENEVEDEEYNKPLDPDSDDEKIRLLLRKHRRAFSVLRLGPHHV
ncbi:homeobox protein Nkx-6.3 [Myripristis murdjan]|uniref:NK6 homeobox 3 n=1 Tax=Myripristis murdjan TaxID=586833 RepID=A0A668AXK8_9TELE|nr:homeobox protein Nkx-6.3 [Myripristis murdjan]XP_029915882.1 homeobox protein Nkx-6.3 [Myripristis murdjan]